MSWLTTPPTAVGMAIDAFVTHKRALARKYAVEASTLALFARTLDAQGITELTAVTPTVVDAFLASRPRRTARSYNHLLSVLRGFFAWCVDFERLAVSPVQGRPRRGPPQRRPFLFDLPQMQRLLTVTAALPPKGGTRLRSATYTTAFALLYGLGLRVGELTRLTYADVGLTSGVLVIRASKFGKSRLVPMGPRLTQRLADYLAQRAHTVAGGCLAPDTPVFALRGGRPVHPGTLSQQFHQLMPQLGLPHREDVASPRLHHLRHSFAVGTLLRWYRTGDNPAARLSHLSTFLGHVDPASTAVYLTMTPELLDAANMRFAHLAAALAMGPVPKEVSA